MRALLLMLPLLLQATQRFDIVVYGGTSAGVMAAVAAGRAGRSVALLEPRGHVGGMLSGGLGRTDMDRQENVIGGLSREFFERVGRHYGREVAWTFEPKVAEAVLRQMLHEAKVTVLYGHRLISAVKNGDAVASLRTEAGGDFGAGVFIDASYEGDLMKAADVSYVVGREARSRYGESLAGRQDFLPGRHQIRLPVSPFDEGGNLLPYIQPEEKVGALGEGDGKFQAYCYRLCLTSDPANRKPIPRPADYDRARFGLVLNFLKAAGDGAQVSDFLGISAIPNNKTDINAAMISTNPPGASWEYPEASWERRRQIERAHLSWAHGLLYLLGNDESVPAHIRDAVGKWGLTRDEFTDTGGWPHQLYIREARRMLGEYVLTQHDVQKHRRKYDSVGMAGYNIDIREVQWVARTVYRFPNMGKEVLMEGYVSVPVDPWEIPYRALLPRQDECSNLLVPAAISASTVAYASFRMEPQYMIAGHSAGTAAALAVATRTPVHLLDIGWLQKALRREKQILRAPAKMAE